MCVLPIKNLHSSVIKGVVLFNTLSSYVTVVVVVVVAQSIDCCDW